MRQLPNDPAQLGTPYSSSGVILKINTRLLGAAGFGFIAYVIWPSSSEGWGLGLISVLLWVAVGTLLVEALIAMIKLYTRDKAVADYLAQGKKPKSSKMASDDVLKEMGMR